MARGLRYVFAYFCGGHSNRITELRRLSGNFVLLEASPLTKIDFRARVSLVVFVQRNTIIELKIIYDDARFRFLGENKSGLRFRRYKIWRFAEGNRPSKKIKHHKTKKYLHYEAKMKKLPCDHVIKGSVLLIKKWIFFYKTDLFNSLCNFWRDQQIKIDVWK